METVKKVLRIENFRTVLGPCMITFAIPLMIPGFTLTLVPLDDETGFSKFSALHVIGMIMLAISGILIVAGCIIACTVGKVSCQLLVTAVMLVVTVVMVVVVVMITMMLIMMILERDRDDHAGCFRSSYCGRLQRQVHPY